MNEELYRRLAAEYVRQYGAELRSELDVLNQNEVQQITPSLDRRMRSEIGAVKRRRTARFTGVLAACLAFVLLVPSVLFLLESGMTTSPGGQSDAAEAPTPSPPPAYEIIPLSFALPNDFSVSAVEQDKEKTVYYLQNSGLDDVVMTMEYAGDTALFGGLTELTIQGRSAYGSAGQGYSLLAFEKQDVLYVLTCRHDINTLVALSKSILV